MNLLALEFSTACRSVAVLCQDRLAGLASRTQPLPAAATQLIDEALTQARLPREQIDCLALGLGPGSYTGIRTAIALAQGWQLAREIRLLGLPSFECLAAQAQALGWIGTLLVAIDAQRGEFYVAAYRIDPGRRQQLEPLHLVDPDQLRRRAHAATIVAGPDPIDGLPDYRRLFPEAATLARLARDTRDFVPGEVLEPIYLRETRFTKAPPPRPIPPVSRAPVPPPDTPHPGAAPAG